MLHICNIQQTNIYTDYTCVYIYIYLCLSQKSWVFHGIQGHTPGAPPMPNMCVKASLLVSKTHFQS